MWPDLVGVCCGLVAKDPIQEQRGALETLCLPQAFAENWWPGSASSLEQQQLAMKPATTDTHTNRQACLKYLLIRKMAKNTRARLTVNIRSSPTKNRPRLPLPGCVAAFEIFSSSANKRESDRISEPLFFPGQPWEVTAALGVPLEERFWNYLSFLLEFREWVGFSYVLGHVWKNLCKLFTVE